MSAETDFDNEPLVLPPLSAAIVVRCLEQDEWLVKIGVGLLDAFLLDYISTEHPNSNIAAVYRRLKSTALLASLLDSLGVSEIQTSKRKQRALHAFIGAIYRELSHDRLTQWLKDLFRTKLDIALSDVASRKPLEVVSIHDSDSDYQIVEDNDSGSNSDDIVQMAEESLADLSVRDDDDDVYDMSIVEEMTTEKKAQLAADATAAALIPLPLSLQDLQNDKDDIYCNERNQFLRVLRSKSVDLKKPGRPMSVYGLDINHNLEFYICIRQMPPFPVDYPPPLPELSDKGLFEALTTKGFYPQKHEKIYDNERLEFLGDTVLSTIVTNAIFDKYPMFQPNDLSELKRRLVNNKFISFFSDLYGLTFKLRIKGTIRDDDDGFKKRADTFEAYIGAYYREKDYSNTNKWLIELLEPFIVQRAGIVYDERVNEQTSKSKKQKQSSKTKRHKQPSKLNEHKLINRLKPNEQKQINRLKTNEHKQPSKSNEHKLINRLKPNENKLINRLK